ncbi:hypothetical protein HZB97_00990 [Candidatus Gottesmanbacteria bacterium]|nr:hypothetical protein [Candidatus Gottesmanbacteria bacterium]
MEKRVIFRRTPFDLPVLLFAISYLLSTIFASANKVEALTMPGGTGTILALTVLYFIITNHLHPGGGGIRLLNSLLASAVILSLFAIYQFIGLGEAFVPAGAGLDWLRLKTFSPAGGPLVLATFLAVSLALVLARIYADWKADRRGSSTVLLLYCLTVLLISTGLGLTVYQLLTTAHPVLLPQTAGWVIALEAFKRFPFFGVGPENFISAFTTGKPIELNLSQFWALRFGVSSNFYFHLLTTVGILGLGAWLFLVWKVIKAANKHELLGCYVAILLIFAILIFLPANFLLLTTFYLLLALLGASLTTSEIKEESKILPQIIFIIVLLVVGISLYGVGRVFAAELFFKQSFDAAAQNKGTETYNLQIKTIQTNPYYDIYRIAYSQTNLALANAIAQKKDLADQDRQNISQLVQQAIREAKVAVALGQTKASNWENLANLYRNLINFAQGADQWTIAAYNQAVFLDPANPILRLNLGGVYYSLLNWDEAIRQFTIAVNLKPDFANGHYNLASAYREKEMIAEAVREMEQVQALVAVGTNDYQKTSQELDDLRAKLPKEEKPASPSGTPETLAPPATAPAGLKPPLTLPKEASPSVKR